MIPLSKIVTKTVHRRAWKALAAACLTLLLLAPAMAEESAAEMISSYRLKHGEVAVVRDPTLDRIAQDQARAMAAQDNLSHDALGPFASRVAPANAGRAAENIAYGYDSFDKTLDLWINSSEHRKNLLLSNATRVGIASAKTASGKRTYWAMVIAGDYRPAPGKGRKDRVIASDAKEGPLVKRDTGSSTERKSSDCHIKLLGLCL